MSYLNPWLYNNIPFDSDQIGDLEGFVYLITDLQTNKKYIGKKSFWSRKRPKKGARRVTKESDWKKYYSSSDVIKTFVKQGELCRFQRTILHLCPNKLCMSFNETKEQFIRDVLFDELYYNETVMGKYYTSKSKYYTPV